MHPGTSFLQGTPFRGFRHSSLPPPRSSEQQETGQVCVRSAAGSLQGRPFRRHPVLPWEWFKTWAGRRLSL